MQENTKGRVKLSKRIAVLEISASFPDAKSQAWASSGAKDFSTGE